MKIIILSLSLLCLWTQAGASEIDSFTQRYESLSNSQALIDQMANRHVQQALTIANGKGRCSERTLMNALRVHFQIILSKGQFMRELMSSKEIEKRSIPRVQSIYKYHRKTDGYLLVRPAADHDGIGMGVMIQYGDLYMGTDKFEHIFGRGYNYYYEHFINNKPLENTLEQSAQDEKHLLGGMWFETGVYSYADLVANFNGIRFWNDILKQHPDPLGRELTPVVRCEKDRWVQNREITFADYFDSGVDESVNCVQTATQHGAEGVLRSLQELQKVDPDHVYSCPVRSDQFEELKSKYGSYSRWLFNFQGIKKFEYNFPSAPEMIRY